MTAAGISQKEYLKKYLSSGGDGKKKKKKKAKAKPIVNRLRIVDDDVDIQNLRPLEDDELELYDLQEDAPQIAGIIDERPEEVKNKEKFGATKWKVVADESDMGVKIIDKSKKDDVEKNPALNIHGGTGDGDLSPPQESRDDGHTLHNSEESPPQKNRSIDNSPVNEKSKKYDSDESPPRKNRKSVDDSLVNKKNKKYDSDESPPRKNKRAVGDSPVYKRKQNQDSDESPPRRNHGKGRVDAVDELPHQKSRKSERDAVLWSRQRQNYDSEESSVRKNRKATPPKRRHGESLSYRKKRSDSEDNSLRAKGHKYDSDTSPPRRSRKNGSQDAQSPTTRGKYNSDESPPRKEKRKASESPPKRYVYRASKVSHRKEISPCNRSFTLQRDSSIPGRMKQSNERLGQRYRRCNSDESPPRRRRPEESLSPPNRGKRRDWPSPKSERKRSPRSPDARYRKGRDVQELSRKRSRWGDEGDVSWSSQRVTSNRNVSPTNDRERTSGNTYLKELNKNYHKKDQRNSSSQRRSDSDVSPERKPKPADKEDSRKQTLDGRKAGLVGADELKAEIADLRHREKEMFQKMDGNVSGRGAAPIMRDRKTGKKRNLEEEKREKEEKDEKQAERDAKYMQWGRGLKQASDKAQKMEDDLYEMSKPLARYADDADLDKYLREQEREGDPMLQYIKSKSKTKEESCKPQYQGSFMPNRFGIRPGYRWDGVDRSNGYEKQWFETQNARKAVEEEAYKWSTSDM